ncbi:MAG TPA: VOC family protein [Mycobacteriales bacterium]|nr:VOC family protein [Mycobacteriales bacterium]
MPPAGGEPSVWLQPSAGPKQGKNRNHLDLRAPDQAAEIGRALGLGATRVEVRQTGEEPLADPVGSEFCILR